MPMLLNDLNGQRNDSKLQIGEMPEWFPMMEERKQ